MSERTFRQLAEEDPEQLLLLLDRESGLTPSNLTFAAEVAGETLTGPRVVQALLLLLKHPSAVVREGAIYGLAHHDGPDIDAALTEIGNEDVSPGVCRAALSVLDDRS